ncbi:hypothetical protein A9Q81_21920 [Gammaproteobacteria bacterium 42_54_T18]|nr:hypothetical protein A9Q81_21920 [Gammaproteobacteria bacterium 42_54_T18]
MDVDVKKPREFNWPMDIGGFTSFVVVVLNVIFSIIVLELWLRMENKIKSRSWMAISGILILLVFGGLLGSLHYSVKIFVPNLSSRELGYAWLGWIGIMLVYLLKFFAPRRMYYSFFKEKTGSEDI